jgi:hypothetical protein
MMPPSENTFGKRYITSMTATWYNGAGRGDKPGLCPGFVGTPGPRESLPPGAEAEATAQAGPE